MLELGIDAGMLLGIERATLVAIGVVAADGHLIAE